MAKKLQVLFSSLYNLKYLYHCGQHNILFWVTSSNLIFITALNKTQQSTTRACNLVPSVLSDSEQERTLGTKLKSLQPAAQFFVQGYVITASLTVIK